MKIQKMSETYMDKTYKVGQVLYVLTNKETKIFPIQVVEEITKKTLSGESISYVVRIGRNNKLSSLSEVEGSIFEDVDSLRSILTERVIATINSVIDNAVAKSSEWYHQQEIHSPLSEVSSSDEEKVIVRLADGTFANLKMTNLNVG